MSNAEQKIEQAFALAAERFASMGVDAQAALDRLAKIPLSLHCWQGDDVGGFENSGMALGGGLAVTGAYPGRARSADELRSDLDLALSLIPGRHRVNLHASYAETGGRRVDRDALEPSHFQRWIDWASQRKMGLDFNPTFFAHPKARSTARFRTPTIRSAISGFNTASPAAASERRWAGRSDRLA